MIDKAHADLKICMGFKYSGLNCLYSIRQIIIRLYKQKHRSNKTAVQIKIQQLNLHAEFFQNINDKIFIFKKKIITFLHNGFCI